MSVGISHDRCLVGVGTGWNREETTVMGGDVDHCWTQAREAVRALQEW
jgi:alkanesulfonate monooxygenase SsuD/methylene tetrahydromethanopterin reductase-like flavin-dependent oxidoreductase (luciferase family)